MHQGQLVFSQLMRHLPLTTFRRCVARYAGEHKVKSFSCLDQYLCMAFAQLTFRESLRDIETSLRAQSTKLYHLGIRGTVSRNTLVLPEPGAYYVMDRGYLDFQRLYHMHEAGSFFVTRAKSNLKAERATRVRSIERAA